MRIKPKQNLVAMKVLEDERTQGGIIIPGNARLHKFRRARVLATGPTVHEKTCVVGDLVLIPDEGGVIMKYFDEECLLIKSDEILAGIDESIPLPETSEGAIIQ